MRGKQRTEAKSVPSYPMEVGTRDPGIELPPPLDLSRGVRIENVFAYLERRFEQASKDHLFPPHDASEELPQRHHNSEGKCEDAVARLFLIAHRATSLLERLIQSQPERVARYFAKVRPAAFPKLASEWPEPLSKLVKLPPAPKSKRKDATVAVAEEMRMEAESLFALWQRCAPEDDPPSDDNTPPVLAHARTAINWETLEVVMTSVRAYWPEWEKIFTDADRYKMASLVMTLLPGLPAEGRETYAKIWWQVELEVLKARYGSPWYLHPMVLAMAGKHPNEHADKARGNVARQFENAFKRALWGLFSERMQGKLRDAN